MRKLLLFIITVCYLGSATGTSVQWHYCMGKLRSIDLGYASHEDACSKCGMQKKQNSCCKDDIQFSKVTDAHQQPGVTVYNPVTFDLFLPEPVFFFEQASNVSLKDADIRVTSPPLLQTNRNILFCVFRC